MPRQVRIQPENPSAATVRTQVRPVPPATNVFVQQPKSSPGNLGDFVLCAAILRVSLR